MKSLREARVHALRSAASLYRFLVSGRFRELRQSLYNRYLHLIVIVKVAVAELERASVPK